MKVAGLSNSHNDFPVFSDDVLDAMRDYIEHLIVYYFLCKLRNPSLTAEEFCKSIGKLLPPHLR